MGKQGNLDLAHLPGPLSVILSHCLKHEILCDQRRRKANRKTKKKSAMAIVRDLHSPDGLTE